MNTKESVRKRAAQGQAAITESMRLAYVDGRLDEGAVWGRKLWALQLDIDAIGSCRYETGPDVDHLAESVELSLAPPLLSKPVMGIDPAVGKDRSTVVLYVKEVANNESNRIAHQVSQRVKDLLLDTALGEEMDQRFGTGLRQIRKHRCGRVGCGRDIEKPYTSMRSLRDPNVASEQKVFCSEWCAQDFGMMANPTSRLGLARSVMSFVEDAKPVGISARAVIAHVASMLGIEVSKKDLDER